MRHNHFRQQTEHASHEAGQQHHNEWHVRRTAGVPTELGGGGASVHELAGMLRTLAHHCSSTALAFAMHTHLTAVPSWRWSHQKVAAVEPLLKRIAAEKIFLSTSGGSDWVAGAGKAERRAYCPTSVPK